MRRVALVGALLAVSTTARAASEGGASASHFFWEAFNLLLLIGVIVYFARKPVLSFLDERRSQIEQNIQTSEKLLSEAQARLAEWSQRAAQIDTEMASIKEVARKAAEQERAAIIEAANATAERIRTGARAAADREVRLAQVRLHQEAAELAVELAGKLLREQVSEADQTRLVDEFIQKIESGGVH